MANKEGNGCCCDCCMLLCDPCMPLCVKRCCCCPPTSDDSYPKIFYGSVSQEDQESTDHGSPGHGSPGELQSVVPVAKIFKFPQKFQELSPHPQLDDNNEGFIRPVITEQPSTCRGISMTLQNDGFSFDPGDLDSEDNEEEDDRVDSVACKRKVSFATDYSNVYQKSPEESNEEDSDDMLVYSGVRASSIPSHVNVGSIERTPEHTLLRKCDVPRPRRCSSLQTNFAAEISLKLKQEMMMPQSPGSPSIHFALYYDKQNSCLTVHISKAVHLYTSSPVDSSNPYVMTYLLPCKNTMQQSPSIKGTHDPKFDYVFKFFGIDPEAVEQQVLVIKVYINNVNHFIGGIIHELKNSDLFGNSIIREISEFDEHSSLKESYQGDVLITLCFKSEMRILDILILEACNLRKDGTPGIPNPYVKVNMMYQGQRMFKLKTSRTKERRTVNPVFNERCEILLSTMNTKDIKIDIVVMSYDRFGHNHVVGSMSIGELVSHDSGQMHWKEVMRNHDTAVSRWHAVIATATDHSI